MVLTQKGKHVSYRKQEPTVFEAKWWAAIPFSRGGGPLTRVVGYNSLFAAQRRGKRKIIYVREKTYILL
jgi:hypothetical protein